MKAKLCFVPPGGGEQDYQLDVELPGVPNPGDYVVLWDQADSGKDKGLHNGFIVRRCWWWIKNGKFDFLVVEAEFANPIIPHEDHSASIQMYARQGKKAKDMEWT